MFIVPRLVCRISCCRSRVSTINNLVAANGEPRDVSTRVSAFLKYSVTHRLPVWVVVWCCRSFRRTTASARTLRRGVVGDRRLLQRAARCSRWVAGLATRDGGIDRTICITAPNELGLLTEAGPMLRWHDIGDSPGDGSSEWNLSLVRMHRRNFWIVCARRSGHAITAGARKLPTLIWLSLVK
jgi:hypothetical protein